LPAELLSLDPDRVDVGSSASLDDLAPRPPATDALCRAASDASPRADGTAVLLGLDRAVSERILAIIRTELFGIARPPLDLHSAISALGTSELARVGIGVGVVLALRVRDRERTRSHWIEAYLSASLASHLVAPTGKTGWWPGRAPTPGELWVGAALQDVGRLVLDDLDPAYTERLRVELETSRSTVAEAEQVLGPLRHAAVGYRLALRWQLPPATAALCRDHEDAARTNPESLRVRAPYTALLAGTSRLATLAMGHLSARAGERVRTEACALLDLEMPEALALMHHVVAVRGSAQRLSLALLPAGL
jgi:HD-like signal output (HDOD) protein